MKRVFLRLGTFLIALTCVDGWAQTAPPSLKTDSVKATDHKATLLQEVVVESATRRKIPQGIAFIPTKREKNLASDAVNLIEMMALTELPYDYRTNAVTTPNGSPVVYFIDGREATKRDLKTINPKDVDRIEYFLMPTFGEFMGKHNVVNYVMKKYLTGGFTRVYAHQYLDGGFGDYTLSSRLVYKKVTLDGYFDGSYMHDNKAGAVTDNTFKDFNYNSTSYNSVAERIDGRDSQSVSNDLGAFIRTLWSYRAIDLTAIIGWNWTEVPHQSNRAATTYSPEIINSSFFTSERSSLNINPYARLTTKFTLPHKQTLTLLLSGKYLSERDAYTYSPQNLSSIFNGTRGKDWSVMGSVSYAKIFNTQNSLNITANVIQEISNIDYTGSYYGPNKYKELQSSLSAGYSHSFN